MQRLDYIQGTGTQYIDTKYIPTQNTAFEITLSNVTKGEYAVFGQNNWSPNSRLLTSQTELRWYYNSSYYMVTADVTGKHTIYLKNNYVKLDGVVKNSSTSQNSNIEKNTSIKLFSCNGQYIGRYRLYSFKIYENDVLVVDLIPVRADNGEVCLVDMITKKYYSNNGTGAFTAGPILEPAFSHTEAVMLSGQTAYFKKSGLMYNHGTITLDNALAARTFSEGYIGPDSILRGTDLADTEEYKQCEIEMMAYLGDDWQEKEGERTIITNSNNIANRLAPLEANMQVLADGVNNMPSYRYDILEYLETVGKDTSNRSYIYLYKSTGFTKLELDFAYMDEFSPVESEQSYVCSMYYTSSRMIRISSRPEYNDNVFSTANEIYDANLQYGKKQKLIIDLNNHTVVLPDNTTKPITYTDDVIRYIYIGSRSTSNVNMTKVRFYSMKLHDADGNLVADYVPARRIGLKSGTKTNVLYNLLDGSVITGVYDCEAGPIKIEKEGGNE